MKEKAWINCVKALCMLSVYLLHCEAYGGTLLCPLIGGVSCWLSPFYVNAFFFVSGYLFFHKKLKLSDAELTNNVKKSYSNIFFRLLIPTIIFSTFLYIPKVLFHSRDVSVSQYLYDVFGGVSFWFTSALIVSQLIILTLLLTRIRNIFFYLGVGLCLFVCAIILRSYDTTPFPWYYRSGMAITFFMALGGVYGKYENSIDHLIGKFGWLLIAMSYVILIINVAKYSQLKCAMMSVNVNVTGFFVSLLGISLVVGISKVLPESSVLNWIGRHSIVLYFLSGVLPAIFGTIFLHVSVASSNWRILFVWTFSFICGCGITWIVNRYLPFLLDIRRISDAK